MFLSTHLIIWNHLLFVLYKYHDGLFSFSTWLNVESHGKSFSEGLFATRWLVDMSIGRFFDYNNWCVKTQSTLSNTILWAQVPGLRKSGESGPSTGCLHAFSSLCPWMWVGCGSCFKFQPLWHWLLYCDDSNLEW